MTEPTEGIHPSIKAMAATGWSLAPTCAEPAFTFDAVAQSWGECTKCGRLAWDHEQADPLADMMAAISGRFADPQSRPPTMRTVSQQ